MQNKLLSIFNAITPDNIKNIKVIQDSMKIFIELLEQYSFTSIDIKDVLSENTTTLISDELVKIYLYDYYSMLQNIKSNKNILNKFKKWNETLNPSIYPIGMPYIGNQLYINFFTIGEPGGVLTEDDPNSNDIGLDPFSGKIDILQKSLLKHTPENYYINRKFKESKGLKKSINFIYDIMNEHLTDIDERRPLEITETGNPFELNLKGSVDKDIYVESVGYLAHPLGFVYNYIYSTELVFSDNFFVQPYYDNVVLEVRCLYGNSEAYNNEIYYIVQKENYLKIVFKDLTYLLEENDVVKYFDENDNLIKIYPSENHCSIYLRYDLKYKTIISDAFKIEIIGNESEQANIIDTFEDHASFYDIEEFDFGFVIDENMEPIGTKIIRADTDVSEIVDSSEVYSIDTISETFSIQTI